MSATMVQEGRRIDYTPSTAVVAGQVVVQGELVGVATEPIAANTLGSLAVEGVFDFTKATGASTAIVVGANVYWDVADTEAKVDDESAANKLLGKSVLAATDADETVRIKLNQ